MLNIKFKLDKNYMALCRCKVHPPQNIENYPNHVQPDGYPNTSSICGKGGCDDAGLIWLTRVEYGQFLNGTTILSFATNVTKVKVQQV
jgi:hypothetical protein